MKEKEVKKTIENFIFWLTEKHLNGKKYSKLYDKLDGYMEEHWWN